MAIFVDVGSSNKKSSSFDPTDDFLEERKKRRKKQEDEAPSEDERKQQLAKAQAEKEAEKERIRKEAEKKAKEKAGYNGRLWGLPERIGDLFEANSEQDKAKRKNTGQPELYKDQQSEQDRKKLQSENFDFAKEDMDARRDHYKRMGVDLDQFKSDKNIYDKFIAENKGKSLAKLTLENKIPEEAKRYERTKKRASKVESAFRDAEQTASGRDNLAQQIERAFVRGAGEQVAKLPRSAQVAGAGVLDFFAPEGSKADKLAQAQYEAGRKGLKDVEQQIVDTGYGTNEKDNQFASNVAAGAGSLTSSIALAGLGGTSTAAGVFGVNAGAGQYVGARDAGKSDAQALATGTVAGMAEGFLEKLGLEKFLGAGGGPVKKFFTRALSEGAQEFSQSTAQSGVEMTYSSVDVSDAIVQALQEGGYGMLVGGGAGLALSIGEDMQNKGVPPEVAEPTSQAIAAKVAQAADEELPVPGTKETPSGQPPVTTPSEEKPESMAAVPSDQIISTYKETHGYPSKQGFENWLSINKGDLTDTQVRYVLGKYGDDAPSVEQTTTTKPPITEVKAEVAKPKGSLKPIGAKTAGAHAKELGLPDGYAVTQSSGGFMAEDGSGETHNHAGFAPKPGSTSGVIRVTGKTEEEVVRQLKIIAENQSKTTQRSAPAKPKGSLKPIKKPAPVQKDIKTQSGNTVTKADRERFGQNAHLVVDVSLEYIDRIDKGDVDGATRVLTRLTELPDFGSNKALSERVNKLKKLKPRVDTKPKGSLKPIKTKADVKLTYPETKDLPTEQKEKMPSNETMTMKTVSGRDVVVDRNTAGGGRKLTVLLKKEAITEAKAKKDKDSEIKFRRMNPSTITTEQGNELKAYVFGDTSKIEPNWQQNPRSTSSLTPGEAADVNDSSLVWNSGQVKEFVKAHPKLNDNPVMTYEKSEDGTSYLVYKDKNWDTRIKVTALGISEERIAKAGLKNGQTVDLSEALKTKNKVPAINRGGVNYDVNAQENKQTKRERFATSKTPEDLIKLINDLNKAGQKNAITRRGQLRSKKASGMFSYAPSKPGSEAVKLRDDTILDPKNYVGTLAHELAHAIDWTVNGTTSKTLDMFPQDKRETIKKELMAIVDNLEGKAVVEENPKYYYKPTEMWARYIETWMMENASARELAPTVTDELEGLIVEHQSIRDLFDAIDGNMDKGHKNHTWDILKDRRQIYRKRLGKSAGDAAYDAEVLRRAELQRASKMISATVKEKFKGVKDSGEALFRAAEAIKIVDGQIDYGTKDFKEVEHNAKDAKKQMKELQDDGWTFSHNTFNRDAPVAVFEKVRYTPEEAKNMLAALTPEGRKLIEEFNLAKEDAKDTFNRDLLKEIYKIDGKIEGWVHHYWEKKPMKAGKRTGLRLGTASAQKKRTGQEGYVEDFRKATEKAMLELETFKINNAFIQRQLARVSKPIAKGQTPDAGWTEVIYDKKYGMRLPGESRESIRIQQVVLPEDGFFGSPEIVGENKFMKPVHRYQVPTELAEHYRNVRRIPEEMNKVVKTLDLLGKYWTVNVLSHPGTASTNFISGGLQYGAKLMNDFYMDALTGNYKFDKTRSDLVAPIVALTPRGWTKAPDWIWGGYRSSFAGQMASDKATGRVDAYGNQMLRLFGAVENYWKRAIALSEGANFTKERVGREIRELSKQEKALIAEMNKPIDLFAYDYDNKALWMDKFDSKGGKLLKPFITYPYKYTKMVVNLASAPFDRSLSWQERTSKALTLGTMLFLINLLLASREDEQETPVGSSKTPYGLRPGGRAFFGKDASGREMFLRTAKYPFFNLTSAGRSVSKGHWDEVNDIWREQFGTIGPGLQLGLLAIGQKSEFDQYKPTGAILGEQASTLIPGFRIFNDVGRMMDPNSRSQKTFTEGVGSNLPIWGNEDVLRKWRGEKRQLKIPDEPEEGRQLNKDTTTPRDVTIEPYDILRSLFTGVYISRIDPKEARAQELREMRSAAEQEINDLLREDPDSQEARDKAEAAGLWISDRTIKSFRSKLKNR